MLTPRSISTEVDSINQGDTYCLNLVVQRDKSDAFLLLEGLLLRPTGNRTGDYKRVGKFSVPSPEFLNFVPEDASGYHCESYDHIAHEHMITII
jgi:hypothetical protein